MNVNKLIEELKKYMERYGDLFVYMDNKDAAYLHLIEDVGIALHTDIPHAIILSAEKIKT